MSIADRYRRFDSSFSSRCQSAIGVWKLKMT
jgi:hypothetical protein